MKKIFIVLVILLSSRLAFSSSTELYWQFNHQQYEYNMSMVAAVYIDDVEQQNNNLELGVFYGDEVRGAALPSISNITGKYVYNITLFSDDACQLTFKLYDHNTSSVLELDCNQSCTFEIDATEGTSTNPYKISFITPIPYIIFSGEGSWNDVNNWNNKVLPMPDENVVIDGAAVIPNESSITVNSLIINENKSLTIQDGGFLIVTEELTNADTDALIIEEGGQIFQNNDDVAATFRNVIDNPDGNWGDEDMSGWQFVASPVANVSVSDFIPADGDYDLYMYDGAKEHQWVNFKKMGSQSYDFSTNPLNNGWTSIDADGDGNNWTYQSRSKYMYSVTYNDMWGDILAENYFVSPKISISNGTILNFKARCTNNEFYPETLKILLSEDSNTNPDDFNIEVENYVIENTSFQTYTYDLSKYAGKDVYVAFYHYVAPENLGSEQLILDDIEFVNDNNFENGRGYLVSYQNANVSDFKGYLNNEASYTLNASYFSENVMANFSLFGNPYPFDIDWNENVTANGIYDGFAIVDSEDGAYKYFTEGYIKAGEGFMVKSLEANDNNVVISKNANRSTRQRENIVNIIAKTKNGSDNLIVRFGENESAGFPKLQNFNDEISTVYVKESGINYAIFNCIDDTKEIPFCFDAKEMGNYTLSFDVKGEFESLMLLDCMTGEKVNLLLEKEYSFIAASDDNAERFVLLMNDNGQQSTDNGHFAYINNGDIVIYDIEGDADISIFDALGRCVYQGECSDVANRISTDGYSAGFYMIQKNDDKGINVQKIVIE